MSRTLHAPMVHLNGTSRESLLQAIEDAYHALSEARESLTKTAPNGRDYYPLGPGALGVATDEHIDRMKRVDSVQKELEAIATAIHEGETEVPL